MSNFTSPTVAHSYVKSKVSIPVFMPHVQIYINHCWNCRSIIDSRICTMSSALGMGYHCNRCGKDLTEFKSSQKSWR